MMTIKELNDQFGINNNVVFKEGNGGFVFIHICNEYADAELCLYGAHLISYKPTGQPDILWMSKRALFQEGKAIRGGVPVCFPWFGPHLTDNTKPQHGFARLRYWEVESTRKNADGSVSVSLSLQQSTGSLAMWPYPFKAVAEFIIGKQLEIKLTVTNTGKENFEYSDALHTYFNISDIHSITIQGTRDTSYYEFDKDLQKQTEELLTINKETDRKYIEHSSGCIISDPGYQRQLHCSKAGSKVTVIWNPWEAKTKTMNDMEPDGYKTFVCIEPVNAYRGINIITLAPGESHTLAACIEQH